MKKKLFRRHPKPYELDEAATEQILSNVFSLCNRQPNTVPLSVLTSYSNYRRERFALQRTLIAMMLILFMILPFCFVVPRVVASLINDDSRSNPIYSISVTTGSPINIPIRKILAQIEERNMPVYKADDNLYTVHPNANGEMTISVTLANRQISSIDITITSVDNSAPQIVAAEITANFVYLYVTDEESGVDFEAITLTREDGSLILPYSIDEKKGCVTLRYPDQPLDVCIPDTRGNRLDIVLKPS